MHRYVTQTCGYFLNEEFWHASGKKGQLGNGQFSKSFDCLMRFGVNLIEGNRKRPNNREKKITGHAQHITINSNIDISHSVHMHRFTVFRDSNSKLVIGLNWLRECIDTKIGVCSNFFCSPAERRRAQFKTASKITGKH